MKKLQNKFLILFLLLSVLPVALLGYLSYNTAYDAVRKGLYQSARIELENDEKVIYQKIKAIDWLLNIMINNEDLQDKIRKVYKNEIPFKTIDAMLKKQIIKIKEIKGLVFLMPDNRVYTSKIKLSQIDEVRFKLIYGRLEENTNRVTWLGANPAKSDLFGEIANYTLVGAEITNTSQTGSVEDSIKIYYVMDGTEFNSFVDLKDNRRNIIIFDQSGKLIFDQRDSYFKQWNLESIDKAQEIFVNAFGTFDDKIKRQDIVVSHLKSQLTNWTIVELKKSEDFYKDIKKIAYSTLIIVLLSLLIIISIYVFVAKRIAKPLVKIANEMKNFDDSSLSLSFSVNTRDEIGKIYEGFNKMINRINKMISELTQKENEKKEAEFRALNYQINPHFLYNTMSTIRFMALNNQQNEIANAILILNRFFRTVLNSPQGYVSVKDEMSLLKDYIGLLQIRYKGRLHLEMNNDPRAENYVMPTMLLQPIVENAVMHGLNEKLHEVDGGALVRITTAIYDSKLLISIYDNGKGMPFEEDISINKGSKSFQKVSIGLKNIKERIRLIYGNDYGIDVKSEKNSYTCITVTLPCIVETSSIGKTECIEEVESNLEHKVEV